MENQEKNNFLLIIDGSSLLTTQFYGNLPKEIMFAKTQEEKERYFYRIMQSSDGTYTNAVYGFMRVLFKILREQRPKYLAITWDVGRDTFRRELYADYKGNRGETLVPLKNQFVLCQELLKEMGVKQFQDKKYEADDFSGTLAALFEQSLPVCVMTKDNDYLQLIDEKTTVWLIHSTSKKTEELYEKYGLDQKQLMVPDRTFPFTPELVEKEFGIKPSSVNSLKGLQGDPSDNIKGVPGIGEMSAVALIKEYETVEHLYDQIHGKSEKELKELAEYWKTGLGIKRSPLSYLIKTSDTELVGEKAALLSKQLATIKRDIELPNLKIEDLEVKIDKDKTKEAFDRLEFKSISLDYDKAVKKENAAVLTEDGWMIGGSNPFEEGSFVNNPFTSFAADNRKNKKKLPFEEGDFMNLPGGTESEEILTQPVSDVFLLPSISILKSRQETEQIIQNIFRMTQQKSNSVILGFDLILEQEKILGLSLAIQGEEGYFFTVNDQITISYLSEQLLLLQKAGVILAGIDIKNQLPYLKFTEETGLFDTAVAAYLINPLETFYEAKELSERFLKRMIPSVNDVFGKKSLEEAFMKEEEEFKKICCGGVIAWKCYSILIDILNKKGMVELFRNIEMPLIFTLYDMECRGIQVNKEELKVYSDQLSISIEHLESEIYEKAGESFNINSPKQLGAILFEKMKLPFGKKTKTGYSTSAEVLEKLKSENVIIDQILEYRQLTKLKSTYAEGLAVYIQKDGRIHSTFNQMITATGRISSTEPNLQNIPIRMELGRKIRKVFVPEKGFVFLDADYSQIELRVLAHLSGDGRLINAYKQAQDIHRITASEVFHTPFDEVTSEQRSNAKAVNFGIVYGISSFGLGQGLDISRQEAEDYISNYFTTYPQVKHFLEGLVEGCREQGYVKTMFGRRRPVPDIKSSNFNLRSAEERIAMNSPVQGTAADIIKIAMNQVNNRLKKLNLKSRLLLQIHDELLVETAIDEIEQVKQIMKQEMENAAKLAVPLEVEVKSGENWYEAK